MKELNGERFIFCFDRIIATEIRTSNLRFERIFENNRNLCFGENKNEIR